MVSQGCPGYEYRSDFVVLERSASISDKTLAYKRVVVDLYSCSYLVGTLGLVIVTFYRKGMGNVFSLCNLTTLFGDNFVRSVR